MVIWNKKRQSHDKGGEGKEKIKQNEEGGGEEVQVASSR